MIERAILEAEIAKSWARKRDPGLVGLHQDQEVQRQRIRVAMAFCIAYNASLVAADPYLLHGIGAISVADRLVIVPAIGLLVYLVSFRRPVLEAHLLMGLTTVVGAAMWALMLVLGQRDGPCYYAFGAFTFVMAMNVCMRPTFVVAAGATALMLACFGAMLAGLPDHSTSFVFLNGTCLFAVTLFSLLANWTMERESYKVFLHQRLEEVNRDDLEARNAELGQLSSTDGLTGLRNRRAADEALRTAWQAHRHHGSHFAVVLIDVDYFKLFNDAYGHLQGDICLAGVAAALRRAAEALGAQAFRFGGEEFLVLSPESTIASASRLDRCLMQEVEGLGLAHASRPDGLGRVTVSAGIALSGRTPSGEERGLLEAADLALYEAKRTGRNRSVLAGEREAPFAMAV